MHELLEQNQEIWDLFTQKEEYSPDKPESSDHPLCAKGRLQQVLEPEVSRYLLENGMKVEFPENKPFAVCLTHDVDDIYPPFSHSLLSSAHSLKDLNFMNSASHLFWKFRGQAYSPYRNFSEIMNLEARYGGKSSFYFITAEADPVRFRYNIEDIASDLGKISDMGWEVGLHGGYYSYKNPEAIKTEKKRLEDALGKKVIGYRNHYLRFKIPDSWEILANAGFSYDSTFGLVDSVGFRNGMCHPFKPYNLKEKREIEILEIPLIIMDTTLFTQMHLDFNQAWECTKTLIDKVEKLNGVITLLWHNLVFGCSFRKAWVKLYQKTLEYCSEKDAWITSGEEIYRWWENRS